MKSNRLLAVGGLFGLIAVMLGAFAAHGLKHHITPEMVSVFKIGVDYQFYHTLALIASAILLRLQWGLVAQKYFYRAAICFIIGILCFSGSLYMLALTGFRLWGPITPIGGLFFMIGWLWFIVGAIKTQKVSE